MRLPHSFTEVRRPVLDPTSEPSAFRKGLSRSMVSVAAALFSLISWPLLPAQADETREVLADGHGSALWWSADGSADLAASDGTVWGIDLEQDVRWTSLAMEPGRWTLAGRQGQDRLVLVQGQGDHGAPLAVPRHGSKMLGDPILLADPTQVRGLAWLQGDAPRAMGVRVAMRRSDGWAATSVVAPPGPGTQTALASTTLDDGRLLLLWSAFDGKDDEIHWSIGRDGSWSRPARLGPDNAYPDITPAVTALAGGKALAAWSSYDGRVYRLALSLFDGQAWGPRFQQSASADLFPAFTALGSDRVLQAKDPVALNWTLVKVGPAGEALARTVLEGKRPVVFAASNEGIEFRSLAQSSSERRSWTQ